MRNFKAMQWIAVFSLFFASCKSQTGDFMTKNGYKYTVHVKGNGKTAAVKDYIFYTGIIMIDSDTMQVSNDMDNLPITQIPSDWKDNKSPFPNFEVLSKVSVGDSLTIFIPVDSLKMANPQLEGKKELKITMSIKDIMDSTAFATYTAKKNAEMEAKLAKSKERLPGVEKTITETLALFKAKNLKLEKTSSGLQYVIHEKGTGPLAKNGQLISVDYHGILMDGNKFDSSFERGQPIEFPVGAGNVIPGWDEAFTILPAGTKATIFIPSKLAYGSQQAGPIPPDSDLVFYVEFQKIL